MAVALLRTLEPCVTGVCRLLCLYHLRLCVPACAIIIQPKCTANAGCRREALASLVRAIGICLCWNLETSGPCVLWLGTFPPPNPARALSEVSGVRTAMALVWHAATASPPPLRPPAPCRRPRSSPPASPSLTALARVGAADAAAEQYTQIVPASPASSPALRQLSRASSSLNRYARAHRRSFPTVPARGWIATQRAAQSPPYAHASFTTAFPPAAFLRP